MATQILMDPGSQPELWAGFECSVVRVQDAVYDQIERGGHASRPEDLDLIATLGVKTLRYPVLWERIAPDAPLQTDWRWADERLARIRELGIQPIVGLLHHGSGPRWTSLVDPNFADQLAAFAESVAERYPWVTHYTPVNEPLTTARFAGLYGHWHPHGRDDRTFARALLNECRGVVLAMCAVRKVNPQARLVQTEDLCRVYSTSKLSYQACFENERRWLSFDLLMGRVRPGHPMWHYLRWAGISEREIAWFEEHRSVPDILGLNYYPTSERFLDDRLHLYPQDMHGGNGRQTYVDTEAVRVLAGGIAGPTALIREAWDRFGLPLAVTEAHLGCTREEQLRWFMEIWEAACQAKREGIDVRAVTAWAVLGSYDWDSLMTRPQGSYECGAFDVRSPRPRPTALASLLSSLARGEVADHPVLAEPGWWHRPERVLYPLADHGVRDARPTKRKGPQAARACPVVILDVASPLGKAFRQACELRGLAHCGLDAGHEAQLDEHSIAAVLGELRPWAVVDTSDASMGNNPGGDLGTVSPDLIDSRVVASICARQGLAYLGFSTYLVFDGQREDPYGESDAVNPLCAYGRRKTEMERQVLEVLPSALIIRAGACFGPWDMAGLVTRALRCLARGQTFDVPDDMVVSPAYIPDLAHAALDLLIDRASGLWHLFNPGIVSCSELVRRAAALAAFNPLNVRTLDLAHGGRMSYRSRRCALRSERATILPPLEDALQRYLHDYLAEWTITAKTKESLGSVVDVGRERAWHVGQDFAAASSSSA